MKYINIISHRGNINGIISDKENRPSYIDTAIKIGFEVEVDLRFINDEFWLGHDEPQYKIELSWMNLRKDKIWYHCKDYESASLLSKIDTGFKYFCHSQDPYVCTSNGYIWLHDLTNKINDRCIIPLLSKNDIGNYFKNNNSEPYAICTDFTTFYNG